MPFGMKRVATTPMPSSTEMYRRSKAGFNIVDAGNDNAGMGCVGFCSTRVAGYEVAN